MNRFWPNPPRWFQVLWFPSSFYRQLQQVEKVLQIWKLLSSTNSNSSRPMQFDYTCTSIMKIPMEGPKNKMLNMGDMEDTWWSFGSGEDGSNGDGSDCVWCALHSAGVSVHILGSRWCICFCSQQSKCLTSPSFTSNICNIQAFQNHQPN